MTQTPEITVLPHLLVVDDDKGIRSLLTTFLTQHHFETKAASNASEARLMISTHLFDLIILDVMMPDETGIALLKDLKTKYDIPILLLTACDQLSQKIEGLEFGADDYVTKPFEPLELIARIRTLLKRFRKTAHILDKLTIGDFTFYFKTGVLTYKEQPISLTSTERLLLQALAQRPCDPMSRETLAQKIGHRVSERTVDVQINRLRQKLKKSDPSCQLIHTFRHLGYSLTCAED